MILLKSNTDCPRYTGLFIKTLIVPVSQPIRLELKNIPDLKLGFITILRQALTVGGYELNILMFSNVFHSLTEH